MAKKKRANPQDGLFAAQERIEQRRLRRQRALFIPHILRNAAASEQLAGDQQEETYQTILEWADYETSGKLFEAKETSIDDQFLTQVFSESLGYRIKTKSPDEYELESQFSVPSVGAADGAIGKFPEAKAPVAVIELKGAAVDLDRDKSNGRTAVQQCFDYLNALPSCPWGIVSNFSQIRLYHRESGILSYEEFTLQEMRDRKRFEEFYCLFERGGLLPSKLGQTPRAAALLEKTKTRQREVGDDLYRSYQHQRLTLIEHIIKYDQKTLDEAIRISQKLLDRIIFIAFCEDRGLLNEECIAKAAAPVKDSFGVFNPRWQKFLGLFREVDVGGELSGAPAPGYNGGLFAPDEAIEALDLNDLPWTEGFRTIGSFDYSEEVDVEVLGHLFERSITELEKLRVGGLFALQAATGNGKATSKKTKTKASKKKQSVRETKMKKSAQRKRFGIYYTPPAFTSLIVERTVDALIRERFAKLADEHGVDPEARKSERKRKLRAYWQACLDCLKDLTVCDPACGSGAFLIRAYESLDAQYKIVARGLAGAGLARAKVDELETSIPDLILENNLFGVDLSKEGVEITQLALWIRSARKGKQLTDLSQHIVHGNSLVDDPSVDPHALDWSAAFPSIFGPKGKGGFDCVIGNPPWERVKLQEREFFSLTDPATAEAVSAAERRKRIKAMPKDNPELFASYEKRQQRAKSVLDYARRKPKDGGRFPLTGKGDLNLYMLFAELGATIVAPDGITGLLVPSGIATDDTTKDFFNQLIDQKRLICLYDFENKKGHFEDVHRAFKFTSLIFGGTQRQHEKADFVFFAHTVEETAAQHKQRHIALSADDLKLLNPNTQTCPIFRTRRDAEITKRIYQRVPILIDKNRRKGGNPWGIQFLRMFDQTNDAELFHPEDYWRKKKYTLDGNVFRRGKKAALPLYEAKMVQAYDHRAASIVIEKGNWVRQGQKVATTVVEHRNPEFAVMPRWWVLEEHVLKSIADIESKRDWLFSFKDVTSPTNQRTMIASMLPLAAVVNSAPLCFLRPDIEARLQSCLLANLNSFAYDFVARQKVGGVHLNFFILEQLPVLHPSDLTGACPWDPKTKLKTWISERVLKLTCTAEDMIPLAQACGFKGSRGDGVHVWKEPERARLRDELDAAYFHLYGIERDDVIYILSTFQKTGYIPSDERDQQDEVFGKKSIGASIIEIYDAMAEKMNT